MKKLISLTLTAFLLLSMGAAALAAPVRLPSADAQAQIALIFSQFDKLKQDESGNNPYVNILVARSADKDNPVYQEIVKAYNSEVFAKYLLAKYKEAYYPSVTYTDEGKFSADTIVDFIDNYKSDKAGKTVVKIGVCGSANDYLNAVQYQLDQNGANIYIEAVVFDAYNLPNEALNSGDIDLNAFQHKAYLNKEIAANGYKIEPICDTLIAPLSLYSKKATSIDQLKELAGKN